TGIGIIGTEAAAKPTERLDIGSGNVRVRDINTAMGAATDKIVVADTAGILKTIAASALLTTEPWYIQGTANPADSNTQNIYQQGKVAVGFSDTDAVSGKQLEVKGDILSSK